MGQSVEPVLFTQHPSRGTRISSVIMEYGRPLHAEIMTHRVFTRNAASSRAIPHAKLRERIINDPWVPEHWTLNKPGMQGNLVSLEDAPLVRHPRTGAMLPPNLAWECAVRDGLEWAEAFNDAGYHKQVVNRHVELGMHIRVLVTSTKWENFFKLRMSKAAEPHFDELAHKVFMCLKSATYVEDKYHLPFVERREPVAAGAWAGDPMEDDVEWRLSGGRCASLSYQTVEGEPYTPERALKVTNGLIGAGHMSPLEHLAFADFDDPPPKGASWHKWGCFHDWTQYRSLIDGGNVG